MDYYKERFNFRLRWSRKQGVIYLLSNKYELDHDKITNSPAVTPICEDRAAWVHQAKINKVATFDRLYVMYGK